MKEKDITTSSGAEYRIKQLPFSKGMALKVKLMKLVSGAAPLMDHLQVNSFDSDIDLSFILQILSGGMTGIIDKLDDEETPQLMKDTIQACVLSPKKLSHPSLNIGGSDAEFEDYFSGNYFECYELFVECLKFNYGDMAGSLKKKFSNFISNIGLLLNPNSQESTVV